MHLKDSKYLLMPVCRMPHAISNLSIVIIIAFSEGMTFDEVNVSPVANHIWLSAFYNELQNSNIFIFVK